ncbi:hypothetical protein [Anaeromyxobacter paludicola]|uniref:Uncharacterized protein n=1 Tax=Anaeromyxobacter paludicola TaxID=2918171 RepID=A0ABM7XBF8_9BACT|nr:hypothetical protein [Anaeromyxobacter paludicola]BDG09196.1 hypothetical protein AMPC_23090 [Anaeromyxobacter paludicola]
MNEPLVFPAVDAIPLPAPVWLLQVFLTLCFTLHVVPMTVTLGGGFWALAARAKGADPAFAALAHRMGKWLPYWTAAAVTTGVAALLFLQVLYGPAFYAASVLMAWPWLSVVALVLVGYYGYYFRAYRDEQSPRAAFAVGAVAFAAFLAVSFLYSNVMTLMIAPARHYRMYLADAGGTWLNLADPTLGARWLHMVLGAVAIGGLWVAALGALAVKRGEEDAGRKVLAFGARGFALATLAEVVSGFWFLAALPRDQKVLFMGGSGRATGYLVASLLLTFSVVLIAFRAPGKAQPLRAVISAAGHVLAVIVLMIAMRGAIRAEALRGVLELSSMRAEPQWGVIGIFLVLLVAGLGTVAWMLLQVRRAAPEGAR